MRANHSCLLSEGGKGCDHAFARFALTVSHQFRSSSQIGRKRLVRSAEEQAALEERERATRRAIGKQAAFDELCRELAKERARRRRADLVVRDREAEALRQRRIADTELRFHPSSHKRTVNFFL